MKKRSLEELRREPLILASRSPRRIALLRRLGLPFEPRPSEADETIAPGKPPEEQAVEVAKRKAEAVSGPHGDRIIVAADTIVCLGGWVLGKPRDAAEAREMLRGLARRWHRVVTGLCIIAPGSTWTGAETTRVKMADLSDAEIEEYAATGEPLDKAGGYAIQGEAARMVETIEGDYYNVVGLPLALLLRGLGRYVEVDGIALPPPPPRFSGGAGGGENRRENKGRTRD